MIVKNKGFHNPEYTEKKKKILIRRVVIFVSVVCFLIGSCAGLTQWPKISIDTIIVDGAVILSPDDIKTQTTNFISGSYFYIFKKNNALLYPKEALANFLLTTFPRIKNIQVDLHDYHTLSIIVAERQPFALWCNTTPAEIASSTSPDIVPRCYFLDRTGFVYSDAPDFSGDAYFKYYGLVPYESAIGSSYVSSPDKFTQVSSFVASVKALNITPLYIVAQSQDDFTMYLYGGGKIIFDDKTSLTDTEHNLQKLLQTANLVPQKNGELLVDYIDLRFGNKLYYKVKKD